MTRVTDTATAQTRSAPPPPLDPPATGTSCEIAPGVRWLRMMLPFALDHINLWALEDGAGWTIVDTGLNHPGSIAAWERFFGDDLGGRPVTRLIVTHMHADHAGLAGWITDRFACPLWMTPGEHRGALALIAGGGDDPQARRFLHEAGWDAAEITAYFPRRRAIGGFYAALPDNYRAMADGEAFTINGRTWRVIAGGGHSPEHACLHCPELDLLIAGDMVLPTISSNVSVDPREPEADPMGEWFATLDTIRRRVPDSVLVLPSHGACFHGLHDRIDALTDEQRDVLKRLMVALEQPQQADALFPTLFSRPIRRSDTSLMTLATGEALALLNHLIDAGLVTSRLGEDGVRLYQAVPPDQQDTGS